jgi:uncharacterized protein (TIGR02596 family)
MKPLSHSRQAAFSLIELLVVVTIIAVALPLTIPAVGSIQRSMSINGAGQMLSDALASARQEASTKNRNIELRLIRTGTPPGYRAFQSWVADERGVMSPLGKIMFLPQDSLIDSGTALSPLLEANTEIAGTANFGALGNCPFAAFRIRAGGLPDPNITALNNFLTIRALSDTAVPPVNYYTIRLDPVTGRVTSFRP